MPHVGKHDQVRSDELSTLARQWQADLASWAIPASILDQAPQSPWIHPVEMFAVDEAIPDSPSHQRAREALMEIEDPGMGASVLDVGCGGGRAALALVPPATQLTGVDHQEGMLESFAAAAQRAGVGHRQVLGDWPQVQQEVPVHDVVVCHHVAYNVADLVPFLRALDRHARRRVVLELPAVHPLSHLNGLWKRFWDLDRPTRPTASDVQRIAQALGLAPRMQTWTDPSWGSRASLSAADRIRFARIRLCLPVEREPEVAAALAELHDAGVEPPREVATLWWDVPSDRIVQV